MTLTHNCKQKKTMSIIWLQNELSGEERATKEHVKYSLHGELVPSHSPYTLRILVYKLTMGSTDVKAGQANRGLAYCTPLCTAHL